jgi:DNA-binding NarL/FixJ family response regulator
LANYLGTFDTAHEGTRNTEPPSAAAKISIAIVDDYPIIREGLRKLIHEQKDLEVVAEGQTGQDALDIVEYIHPDVLVLDVNLPDENGIEITHKLKTKYGNFSVVLLTAYDDDEQALHAIRAGASGYGGKDIAPPLLLEGLRQVAHGKFMLQERILTRQEMDAWIEETLEKLDGYGPIGVSEHFTPLSQREMDVLEGVVQGMSNKEIALHLCISHQTVKNHMTSILDKMNVADRTQVAMYAIQHGWIRIATNERQPHRVNTVR